MTNSNSIKTHKLNLRGELTILFYLRFEVEELRTNYCSDFEGTRYIIKSFIDLTWWELVQEGGRAPAVPSILTHETQSTLLGAFSLIGIWKLKLIN